MLPQALYLYCLAGRQESPAKKSLADELSMRAGRMPRPKAYDGHLWTETKKDANLQSDASYNRPFANNKPKTVAECKEFRLWSSANGSAGSGVKADLLQLQGLCGLERSDKLDGRRRIKNLISELLRLLL